ncbi:MAG: DoxX family protein [Bacteroidota bacterium]
MPLLKKLALYLLILFYFVAGVNHFIMPEVYDTMMPPYFPAHNVLNALAGAAEIILALLMIFARRRRMAATGIILLLISFIPVHIYMLQESPMPFAGTVVSPTVAWLRLVVAHPVLLAWAWWLRDERACRRLPASNRP